MIQFRTMSEQGLVIALSLWIATVFFLVLWVVSVWIRKKTPASDSSEELLSDEISLSSDEPALDTKLQSVQPVNESKGHKERDESKKDDESVGYLYFSVKYEANRSILVVKLIKGENIPTQKLFPSKPSVEIQVTPAVPDPTIGPNGIEFEIDEEELSSQTVHFCVCRYDRYSRKTIIGNVKLSLAELKEEGVDLSQETFIRNLIKPNGERKNPRDLWNKLKTAFHEGKLRPRIKEKSYSESLEFGDKIQRSKEEIRDRSPRSAVKIVKECRTLGKLFFSLKYESKRFLVRIIKAEGIPEHEGETPNTMVECALIPREPSQKPSATAVQENSFTPSFEEIFEYNFDETELKKKKLHLVVWYVDAYYHLKDLGEIVYSLSHLEIEGFDLSQTAMLVSKEITLLHQAKASPSKVNNVSSILLSLTYHPATNKLGVFVFQANNLKTDDDNNGVYVEATVLHHNSRYRKMTGFKSGTENPVYNETLLFDLHDFMISTVKLHITVNQKTDSGDHPIGKVFLGKDLGGNEENHWLEAITAGQAIAAWHELKRCQKEKKLINITTLRTRELRSFEFSKRRSQLFE